MSAPLAPDPPAVEKFTALSRILHWVVAALVFTTLLVGFVMISVLGDRPALLALHKTLGVVVLAVMVVRVVNRYRHHPPRWPDTIGRLQGKLLGASERGMYLLLVAQPLAGWAMVSASGTPVTVFGTIRLPPIAPADIALFAIFSRIHLVIAYALVVLIAAHVSVVLLHSITLRDKMIRRMTFSLSGKRRRDIDAAHSNRPLRP